VLRTIFLIDKPLVSDFLLQTIRTNRYQVVSTPVTKELLQDDTLSWVAQHLGDSAFAVHARLFKDKIKFRELIKASYPDFIFRQVQLDEIQNLGPKALPFPFVIKSSVGFFSLGVHVVRDEAAWTVARAALNMENLKSAYPPQRRSS